MSSKQQKVEQLELPLMCRETGAACETRKGAEGLVAECRPESSVMENSLMVRNTI